MHLRLLLPLARHLLDHRPSLPTMASYAAINPGPSEHEDRPASAASHRGRRSVSVLPLRCTSCLANTCARSRHGKRDVGITGQATWASSVINLVNTSAHLFLTLTGTHADGTWW